MSKPFHYWTRFTLAVTLSVTLVVSPAWAGRIFKHRAKHRAAECCVVPAVECCAPAPCAVAADPCGCDGEIMSIAPSTEHVPSASSTDESVEARKPEITDSTPAPSLEPAPTPVPEAEIEKTAPAAETPKVIESEPDAPAEAVEQPSPAAPETEPAPEVTAPEAVPPVTPLEDNLAEPPKTEPTTPAATDDIFGVPPATTPQPLDPATKPAEDIFSTPEQPQPAPAATPTTDDVFGVPTTPPTETAPAASPTTDDLFPSPAETQTPAAEAPASAPTDGLFDAPAPAPAESTAPAADIFATPEADTAKPAEAPNTDALFGEPAPVETPAPAPAPATEGAASDNIFDAPAAAPAEPEKVESDASGLNELFGEPEAKPAESPASPANSQEEKKTDLEFDKLFDSSDIRNPSSGFSGAERRIWVDNTGNFTTVGALISISPSEVKLMKDNGKTSTVALRRLSDGDLAYVKSVLTAMNKGNKSKELLVQHERGKQVKSGVTR